MESSSTEFPHILWIFETRSHSVGHPDPLLSRLVAILMSQTLKCWNYSVSHQIWIYQAIFNCNIHIKLIT